ncbi:MAG: CAF17-like 4Fe-4S cluster assembly/insertion protein YgfZ [Panacagrimonas sp.]
MLNANLAGKPSSAPGEKSVTQALRLDSWAPLRLSGTDADTFLQGQLSADLRELRPDRAQWASYNSPKGRMLAVVLMLRDEATIELWMPRGLLEPIARRLRMFVMRAKVTIDCSASTLGITVFGALASEWLTHQDFDVPAASLEVTEHAGIRVLRAAGPDDRFLLIGPTALVQPLATSDTPGDEAWRRGHILAGVPVVYPETQDRWVAQMANLDAIGGISFSKGCYTGQEVVARLHYLGNLKKRMFLLHGDGPPPAPGTPIRAIDGDGQPVGDIVDTAASHERGFVASAVLQVSVVNPGTVGLTMDRGTESTLSRPIAFSYPT